MSLFKKKKITSNTLHISCIRTWRSICDDDSKVNFDLGNYERFLYATLRKDNNITIGKVYDICHMITNDLVWIIFERIKFQYVEWEWHGDLEFVFGYRFFVFFSVLIILHLIFRPSANWRQRKKVGVKNYFSFGKHNPRFYRGKD